MIAKKALPVSMKKDRWWAEPGIWVSVGLLLAALFALLPSIPTLYRTPDIDSGVFLYMGSRILQGQVPYRDLWDHKPPLIFFINAAGLLIGGRGRWGVWLLELAAVSGAGLLLYRLLRRFFGSIPALIAVAAMLANLYFVSEYGNLPEEYGLPLQVGVFFLLVQVLADKRSGWRPLVMGLLVGLAFSLKQTLIAPGLIAGLFLLIAAIAQRSASRLLDLLKMGIGALAIWAVWIGYFAAQHALPAFWEQAFLYNLFYSNVDNPQRVQAVTSILSNLSRASGFFTLGLIAWLAALPFLLITEDRIREALVSRRAGLPVLALSGFLLFRGLVDGRTGSFYALSAMSLYRWSLAAAGLFALLVALLIVAGVARRLVRSLMRRVDRVDNPGLLLPLGIALVDLPLECVFSALAGRDYYHYFIPLLPSLTILIALLVWAVLSVRGRVSIRYDSIAWTAVLALVILVPGGRATFQAVTVADSTRVREAMQIVKRNTQPNETILQWGNNERMHFLVNRRAASKFAYQQPLFTPGYANAQRIDAFLAELQKNRPALIIDTRLPETPLVTAGRTDCDNLVSPDYVMGLVRADRDARSPLEKLKGVPLPYVPAEMGRVYRWICEQYEPVPSENQTLETWRVYRLRGAQP